MNVLRKFLLFTLVSVTVGFSPVSARPILTFIKSAELPDMGLTLKLMPEAREVPPASPAAFLYQFTHGDQTWKEERFSPIELWKQGQLAGQWVGRDDNKLILAEISRLPPKGDPGKHVTKAMYEQEGAAATNDNPLASEADMACWVSSFADYPHPAGKRLDKQFTRLSSVWIYRLDDLFPNRVVYVFRVIKGNGTPGWVCAQFDLNPQIRIETACGIIEKEFLGSISTMTTTRRAAPRESLTATGKDVVDSEALMSTRQQVINSIRNLKGWWYDITPDYIILSDMKGGAGSMVEQFKVSMKALRNAYKQCIPEPEEKAIGVVRIPATQQEYRDYVGEDNSWTYGLWDPRRKELVICPAGEGAGARVKRLGVLRVAFHEGFHQYAFYALGQVDISMWFNEGYAQYFENASLSNGRLSIEEFPQALATLKPLWNGSRTDLRRLFSLNREKFYDPNEQIRAGNYALSWALVYYLKRDAASPYYGLLDKYVVAMRNNGVNAEQATETMLAGVDLKRLQTDFERFWQSASRQSAARRFNSSDLQR